MLSSPPTRSSRRSSGMHRTPRCHRNGAGIPSSSPSPCGTLQRAMLCMSPSIRPTSRSRSPSPLWRLSQSCLKLRVWRRPDRLCGSALSTLRSWPRTTWWMRSARTPCLVPPSVMTLICTRPPCSSQLGDHTSTLLPLLRFPLTYKPHTPLPDAVCVAMSRFSLRLADGVYWADFVSLFTSVAAVIPQLPCSPCHRRTSSVARKKGFEDKEWRLDTDA
mmetsp:Transcript_18915/g.32559  ORF Transcript_18915/g.32559 Transcript_18915/m.32559 type:complete len:218 (-) Transcript_18915:14-667(-)